MPIDMNSLHLPDAVFWTKSDRPTDPVVRQHGRSHFGVLIDAPRQVNLAEHATLPAFVYYIGSFREMRTRNFDAHGLIAVMDVERNQLRVVRASGKDSGEDPDPDSPPPPDLGAGSNGYGSSVQTIELRERLELPWKPARLILQAVLFDLASPRVESSLVSGTSQFEDPEVEKFLAAERAARNPPPVFPAAKPGAALPSFEKSADSPDIPAAIGLTLKAERVAALDGKRPLLLHGAWRLAVRPEDLVKADQPEYNRSAGLLRADGTAYAAVVTVHLLVVGTVDGEPKTYALSLPVSEVAEGAASGPFSIDLLQLPEFPIADQTVFVYGYSRESASEPLAIGVLDRRPEE